MKNDSRSPYPPASPPDEPWRGHRPVDPVLNALAEDIGGGDLSSAHFLPPDLRASARIITKQAAFLSGLDPAMRAFAMIDPGLALRPLASDGDALQPLQTVLEIEGRARSMLTAERVALNLIQRLSGVATLTAKFVAAVDGTGARIVDTRKTTPGLRALEKQAVRHGGGLNHRSGLYDAVMIKDNHIAALGGLSGLGRAITEFKAARPGTMLEVEADTPEQAVKLFKLPGINVLLLDNMPPQTMRDLVARKPPGLWIEASGGVTLQSVRAIAETGVDFISVGALTHSAPSADFSLELACDG